MPRRACAVMSCRFRRLFVVVSSVAACLLIALASASSGVSGQADTTDEEYESTIEAYQTQVAELEGTVAARGKKINAQRTQIAELKNSRATSAPRATSTPRPKPTSTPKADNSVTLTGNAVTNAFRLSEGNYRVSVSCTGTAYAVFVTLDVAPGSSGSAFGIIVLGETPPYQGTVLVPIYRTGEFVIVQETIGDGTASCTMTFE